MYIPAKGKSIRNAPRGIVSVGTGTLCSNYWYKSQSSATSSPRWAQWVVAIALFYWWLSSDKRHCRIGLWLIANNKCHFDARSSYYVVTGLGFHTCVRQGWPRCLGDSYKQSPDGCAAPPNFLAVQCASTAIASVFFIYCSSHCKHSKLIMISFATDITIGSQS